MHQDIKIHAIAALSDNYIWIVESPHGAVAIDPGDAGPVVAFLDANGLALREVWVTHLHQDHIAGLSELRKRWPGMVSRGPAHPSIDMEYSIDAYFDASWGGTIDVLHVPGHTPDHLAFRAVDGRGRYHVFCGDTLFGGGCGRLFGGTRAQMATSLGRLAAMPRDTLFYPAHEYTAANLVFASHVEPGNPTIQQRQNHVAERRHRSEPSVPVTLQEELETNPFVRAITGKFQTSVLTSIDKMPSHPVELFGLLREMKDRF